MPVVAIAVVLLLILLNAVFALSEMAIVSSRKARLESMAKEGDRGARVALELVADPSGFLATVQIGITLVGVVAGAFSGAELAGPFGAVLDRIPGVAPNGTAIALALVVALVTYLSLIVGELVPKRLALTHPERIAARIAGPMRVLSRVAAPAVWLLRHSTDLILRLFGLTATRDTVLTEDEVKSLIAEGTRAGVFAPEERRMIDGVLRLADRSVRAVMTPRADIAWVDKAADRDALVTAVSNTRHTQLLVCEGSVDEPLGLVTTRDLLAAALSGGKIDIGALLVPVQYVPEQTAVLRLIEIFRRARTRFAVVVDEYGVTGGVVTATDILESIAGELPEIGDSPDPAIVRRPDGSLLVDGLLPIDDFEEAIHHKGLRGDGDFATVAGLLLERLGRLPSAGDRVIVDGFTLEVVDMDERRIDKVLATPLPPPPEEAGEKPAER
jgi:putative hemolysin